MFAFSLHLYTAQYTTSGQFQCLKIQFSIAIRSHSTYCIDALPRVRYDFELTHQCKTVMNIIIARFSACTAVHSAVCCCLQSFIHSFTLSFVILDFIKLYNFYAIFVHLWSALDCIAFVCFVMFFVFVFHLVSRSLIAGASYAYVYVCLSVCPKYTVKRREKKEWVNKTAVYLTLCTYVKKG